MIAYRKEVFQIGMAEKDNNYWKCKSKYLSQWDLQLVIDNCWLIESLLLLNMTLNICKTDSVIIWSFDYQQTLQFINNQYFFANKIIFNLISSSSLILWDAQTEALKLLQKNAGIHLQVKIGFKDLPMMQNEAGKSEVM